jgi:uncharacterized protein (DUF362 family)
MIFKQKADDPAGSAYEVTTHLLKTKTPSKPVIVKPNIVTNDTPPVTTDVRVVEGVVKAFREIGIRHIAVAEGSGMGDTMENFAELGYTELGVDLIDLDKEKTVTLPVLHYRVWKEITVPERLQDAFIVSVPVLKEHSMCGVTISLKNMVGILPAHRYSGYWTFKKSQVHKYNTEDCIADILRIIRPDWAIVDATIGMRGSHLGGTPIQPPLNLVFGSTDPLEADKYGCTLLGRHWQDIGHLRIITEDEVCTSEG